MVTGGGVSSLNETLSTINVPGMSQSTFSAIEHKIGNLWNSCLEEDMMAAGAEERRLAIDRGDFHDGVPAITVVCDGGWSKRSHKHTYNALGGVGVIFGAATGKLLHIGVRNKMCYICTKAETRQEKPPVHTCFKNWSESSQAMEADVIVEGFKKAESLHGVRYMRVVADGDSSVYSKIQELVPVWGRQVTKLECANHCCKCLRSSLEKLIDQKPEYKGKGGLTKKTRVRLVSAVRCAIRMRSKEKDKRKAARKLEHDIRNSVHHIYGDHSKCSNFCKSTSNTNDETPSDGNDRATEDDLSTLLEDQLNYCIEGSYEEDLEESRIAYSSESALRQDLLADISLLLHRVAVKSSRLLGNFTTNVAESWMSIRSKFDGGKIYNRCNRGSWHGRCYGGALRKNFGPAWSPTVWLRTTGQRPGSVFTSLYRQRSIDLLKSATSKSNPDVQMRKRKRKEASYRESNTKKAKREYGGEVKDVIPDVSTDELKSACERYLKKHVQLTDIQCSKVEQLTKQQSVIVIWREERRKRLTASMFGEIVHRNPRIKTGKLVHRILYGSFRGTQYMKEGLKAESNSILEYKQNKLEENEEVEVKRAGLAIDLKNKHLGANTDGIVNIVKSGSCGLLEVKNLLQKNKYTLKEACIKVKGFCLEIVNGCLHLKRNHNYYYQCQGQMNILQMPWLDFVVRRTNPYQIFIERIERDKSLWSDVMLPKLTAFYMKVLLPELAIPRESTSTGIREPELPWFVPNNNTSSRSTNVKTVKTRSKNASVTSESKTINDNYSTSNSATSSKIQTRAGRRSSTKFVGRRISHEWCVDELSGKTQWYQGRVLDVIKGIDGRQNTVYEVLYDGEDTAHELENLHLDLASSSLKFIDI